MSTEGNKAVLRRWTEGLNTGNLSVIEKLVVETYTDNRIVHEGTKPARTESNEERKEFIRGLFTNVRDLHGTLDDIIAEGDKVAGRWTFHWTEVATGKPVTFLAIEISRFVDGKIAENWHFDATAD